MPDSVLTVTYRDGPHAYPDSKIIRRKFSNKLIDKIIGVIWAFTIVHYFLWGLGVTVLFLWALYAGYYFVAVPALLLYIPSYLRQEQFKLGRPWRAFRLTKIWWWVQNYLGVEVVRTQELDPNKQYIFGVHPHGIFILSRPAIYAGVWETLFPGIEIRSLAASPMFWPPATRELSLWLEAINAEKRVAMKALASDLPKTDFNTSGKLSLMVYPGGSKEIFTTDPNTKDNVLIARKGFIKLAVQTGCNLVPGFVFGEKWKYNRKFLPKPIMDFFMKTLRLPLIIFFGELYTWLPLNHGHLTVVFGKAIAVEKDENPPDQYINKLADEFYGQMKTIFEEHKKNLGYDDDEKLTIKVEEERKSTPRAQTPL